MCLAKHNNSGINKNRYVKSKEEENTANGQFDGMLKEHGIIKDEKCKIG